MTWQQIQRTRSEQPRSDADTQRIASRRGRLIGALQARYDMLKDEAEAQFDAWMTQVLRGTGIRKADDEKGM